MIISAYRICKAIYAPSIWSGIGAREFGGRWNSVGTAIIYTAQSRSLAALEQLVHQIKPRVLKGFVIARINFNSSRMLWLDPAKLPSGWNHPVAPASLRSIGDDWVAAGTHVALAVPSAIVPGEWNYLLNPAHRDFAALKKSPPEPFDYDDRLG